MRACVFGLVCADRAFFAAQSRRRAKPVLPGWGGGALAMWRLAPVAPPDFFLDPALLEVYWGHQGGMLVPKKRPQVKGVPHHLAPTFRSERPHEAAPQLQPPFFASSRRPSHPISQGSITLHSALHTLHTTFYILASACGNLWLVACSGCLQQKRSETWRRRRSWRAL
jgi:hypothetical protein